MSITVNVKKIAIGIVVLLVIGGTAFWWNSTKDERAEKAEIETMIKFAQRQALEIAIIEQASKLRDYKQQMAKAEQAKQQTQQQAIQQTPIIPADPKDVGE